MENIHAKTDNVHVYLQQELQKLFTSQENTVTLTGKNYLIYGPKLSSCFFGKGLKIHYFLTDRVVGTEFNLDFHISKYLALVDISNHSKSTEVNFGDLEKDLLFA
jgi:hypothetical protein